MKKGMIISVLVVAVLAVVCVVFVMGRNVDIMEDVDAGTISKIVVYSGKEVTLTQKDDIKAFVDLLQSMKLRTKFNLPGEFSMGGITIEIFYQNGDTSTVIMSDMKIAVDGKSYKCDRDYCDDLHALLGLSTA